MVDEESLDGITAPRRRWTLPRRQIVVQAAIAAVILVSGIAIGSGGTILALKNRIIWNPPRRGGGGPPDSNFVDGLVDRWKVEYGLNDNQGQQIKGTFTAQSTAMRQVWEEFRQREQAEREKFGASMQNILTPEQFQRWEQDFKERAERIRKMRSFGPPGRGGPRGRKPRPGEEADRGGPGPWRPGSREGSEHGPPGIRKPHRPPEHGPDGPPPFDGPPPDRQ